MSDLRFHSEVHLSVPEIAHSVNINGSNMVGKFISELFNDTRPGDMLDVLKWTETGVIDALRTAIETYDKQGVG